MGDFTTPIIDIGANLTNRQFNRDLPQVLRRAHEANLQAILLTGTSMASSRDALALVKRQQQHQQQQHRHVKLFSTVGVHPHDAKDFDEDATIRAMRDLIHANAGIVCAVGECGLDFNRDFSPRDKQERVFRAQVELACELQLPLFLHERDAHETFVKVLTPFLESRRLPPVVVHCFTGSESELRTYIAMGFYIGLTGYVCMDARGFKLRTFAAQIPLDKLLIETDAPYMYPYGNNSRSRCEPKDLRAVVHTLASCYRLPLDEIASATTRNARRVFALDTVEAQRVTGSGSSTDGGVATSSVPLKQTHAAKKHAHPKTDELIPAPPPAPAAIHHTSAEPTIAIHDATMLDGGQGEGGGQVIRIGMALASVLKQKICISSIRANRKIPGLRNQHVRTVQLAQQLSNGQLVGAEIGSSQVVFDPRSGQLTGGEFQADSETGGSVSLMIQGSLPAMLFAPQPTTLSLRGGTHVGFSPPVDFMELPLQQLLSRMGAQELQLAIGKRGFFPGGRGDVTFSVAPLLKPLEPIDLSVFSNEITKISTRVTVYGELATEELGQTFVGALKRAFKKHLHLGPTETVTSAPQYEWEIVAEVAAAIKSKGQFRRNRQLSKASSSAKPERSQVSILTVLETSSGSILTVDRTEKDTPDYAASKIVEVLARHMQHHVCIDEHLADNAIVYMALARGTSRVRVPSKAHRTSHHLETALEIASALTGATFELQENDGNALVTVHGIGFFGTA